jgi:C_GCAxxG_C_C family probable redox protein
MMMKATLKSAYTGLSREQLLDKAYELGFDFEKYSHSCSQSTVAAMRQMLDMDEVVVRIATSSAGGQAGRVTGTCGALVGGTIVLDYFFGRPAADMSHTDDGNANVTALHEAVAVAGILFDKFIEGHGTIICPHLQTRLFGRPFFISDEQEMAKFEQIGGHGNPEKSCCWVVGNTSRWVMEVLLDKNVVRP